MLSPLELLDFAQNLAARIPRTSEYSEERNAAWLAVGTARLRLDDITNAQRALESIDDPRVQAPLRIETGKWAGEHQDSEIGRNILREMVSQISSFQCWLTPRDITDLVPSVFKVLGLEGVHLIARQLEDPFTAGNVHVMLSYQLSEAHARREQLLIAEKLAVNVPEGNRDWALRWVFHGYQRAGFMEDAERVRRLESKDPEEMTREEEALFAAAGTCLADADRSLAQTPPDVPVERLRRFLDYKFNDLKVIFLTDACLAGGVTDPEIEEQIHSESFLRIEAARPMRLTGDTSLLDAGGMARFLFGRPVCQHPADESLLRGEDNRDSDPNAVVLVRQMSGLFRDFERLAEPFSPEQIEQGLWFVFGNPFWLRNRLEEREVSSELREECLRSMINPFRDYYLHREDGFSGTGFYMWWDLLLKFGSEENSSEIATISIDVLRQILQLPGKKCQFAALHGLNHMHPNPAAAAAVRQYLEEHRTSLTADEITWVEACAIGDAL